MAEELAVMRELPARRMESAKREQVKVDSGSLIHVERNSYSVNSRLIGARVEGGLNSWGQSTQQPSKVRDAN